MRTLADMTEEERAECVGMWCGYNRHVKGGKPSDFVIMVGDVNEAGRVPCINPGAPEPKAWAPDPWMLTPCPDLPRAWQADGQPLEADWQYAEYQPGINRGFYAIEETIEKGPEMAEGTTAARRWVGEWEEA